jgi:hypothetical protein
MNRRFLFKLPLLLLVPSSALRALTPEPLVLWKNFKKFGDVPDPVRMRAVDVMIRWVNENPLAWSDDTRCSFCGWEGSSHGLCVQCEILATVIEDHNLEISGRHGILFDVQVRNGKIYPSDVSDDSMYESGTFNGYDAFNEWVINQGLRARMKWRSDFYGATRQPMPKPPA